MTRFAAGAAAVALCLLGACASSPPMRFYTLAQIQPDTRLGAPPGTVRVRIDRVTVAAELDRLQLVRRLDATRLQISEADRWAAPLDEMIRRVLFADLAARLPPNLVADSNAPATAQGQQSLSVDIQEFYADPSCSISLRAVWVLKSPAAAVIQGLEEVQVPPDGSCSGVTSQPGQMSRALATLTDRIAAAVVGSPAADH